MFDFVLAMLLFLLMWTYIDNEFSSEYARSSNENGLSVMKLKSDYILGALVKGGGDPQNWEALDINSLVFPGLAGSDREISQAKLAAFYSLSANYWQFKDKLGVGGFDFFFTLTGNGDLNAGIAPQGNATQVVAQRIVRYNGGIGTATLNIYKPRG